MKNMKLIAFTLIALGSISERMNASDFLKSLNSWYQCGNRNDKIVDGHCVRLDDLTVTVGLVSNPFQRLKRSYKDAPTLALKEAGPNNFTIDVKNTDCNAGGISPKIKQLLGKTLLEKIFQDASSITLTGTSEYIELLEESFFDDFNVKDVKRKNGWSIFTNNDDTKTIEISLKS